MGKRLSLLIADTIQCCLQLIRANYQIRHQCSTKTIELVSERQNRLISVCANPRDDIGDCPVDVIRNQHFTLEQPHQLAFKRRAGSG